MIRKRSFPVVVLLVCFCCMIPVAAVPVAPGSHQLEQSDGSAFTAYMWGDEWLSGWETGDGHSIVYDEATRDWVYAVTGPGGNLVTTSRVVGSDTPPAGVPLHLRPSGKALAAVADLKTAQARGGADGNGVPVTGAANIPVILINFNDRTPTYSPADFTSLLFGTGTGSMKDFYREASYGNFTVSAGPSGISGWHVATQSHDYYGYNNGWQRSAMLVKEAVQKADAAGFNFSAYDRNHDGYVDVVNIVHSGPGRESTGDGTNIHSHSWSLTYGGVGAYTTQSGLIVDSYVIQPETLYTGQTTMGVFAHEYAHSLGVPDLYDYNYVSSGVGSWSLMAVGSWNGVSRSGDSPAQLDAWSRSLLGWVTPSRVTGSKSVRIKRSVDNSVAYQLLTNAGGTDDWAAGSGTGEYFLVENRQKSGFDAALPGAGLVIWHVDEQKRNNNDYTHKLVSLEEADGQFHLDHNTNSGDAADPWYNKAAGFYSGSVPDSRFYNGTASGAAVTGIGVSGDLMDATLAGGVLPPDYTPVADFSATPRSGTAPMTVRFTDKSANAPSSWKWSFGDGSSVNATKKNPVHTFARAGNYTVRLNATNAYGSNITIRTQYVVVSFPPPVVTGIAQAAGVRGRTVAISNLSGTGFVPGATVSLNKTGYPLIAAKNVTILKTTRITGNFTIPANAPLGLRNIDVKNPDGKIGTMAGAFMVNAAYAPSVTGIKPSAGRRGRYVTITNLSGTGFIGTPAPRVRIFRNTTLLTATNVTVVSGKKISCTVTIPSDAAAGVWNVRVINGDNQAGQKNGIFTVVL